MRYFRSIAATLGLMSLACFALAAEPEYVTIKLEIDIARPAADVWAKVGDYCDIGEWAKLDCVISSGDGGVGTVRVLAGGRVKEIMVGQTELSYGYTQPVVEGQFYNLYHGFMEARPVTATTSKMYYTLMLDVSNLDATAREADLTRRRTLFENMLKNIKEIAEAP
jgi:hypothetical protein